MKTNLRFYLTLVRMAKIKNSGHDKNWQGCEESGTLPNCWWDCKLVQPFWKSVWWFLRKLGMIFPDDPVRPLINIYPEDSPARNKDTCSTVFIAALFTIATCLNESRCPLTQEWIQKMCYIYTMEYYSANRNNEFMKFLDKWM